MQLEQLRYLILIHRLGSINKASEQVHLSQQALNTSMKKLEAEIGCPLFIYHARGVRLTDKGLRLVKTAEEVLAKMDDTLRELVRTLPETQREIVLLRFAQDLTLREIAEITELPLRTVQSRLRAALKNLRTIYEKEAER